jgi:hypothetical protein
MGFERQTVNGCRPQANLNPHGNKGADLIETIRMEKLAGNPKLFVPQHPSVGKLPGKLSFSHTAPSGQDRPWAQPRWSRPQTAGAMRVHSSDRFNELLLASESEEQTSRIPSPAPGAPSPALRSVRSNVASSSTLNSVATVRTGSSAAGKRRPQSAQLVAEQRARERLRQQHEAMQERVTRKLRESQAIKEAQQEEEFQSVWDQFQSEQAGTVADVEEFLRLKDMEAMRRANAHCKYWNEEVYDKIHAQIQVELRKREHRGSYNTRWRHAQDEYLAASSRKEAGVFRDIIIQDEYDPLQNAAANIKYKGGRQIALKDPLKTELTKQRLESLMVPGSEAALAARRARSQTGRETVPVTQWANMEATPYGHFAKLISRQPKHVAKDGAYSTTGMRVLGDHYTRH